MRAPGVGCRRSATDERARRFRDPDLGAKFGESMTTVLEVLQRSAQWHIEEGDCLAVLRSLPAACVGAVITDPPYSSGGMFRGDRCQDPSSKYVLNGTQVSHPEFTGDNRDQRSFGYWCSLWLAECQRIAKPGAPVCIFSDWRQLAVVTDVLQSGGWIWRGIAVWDKTEACRPAMGRFASQSEFIVWGSNGAMPHDRGVGCLPGVLRAPIRQDDRYHMTGKPTELMLQVVEICGPDGLVLDPFSGSGTTGVAAVRRGCRYLGIEREGVYAAISRERLLAECAISSPSAQRAGQVPLFGGWAGSAQAEGRLEPVDQLGDRRNMAHRRVR
jgi:site-specific DNA-methyltransferase (adenine-specific)